ncbi:hypothetical protein [Nitrospirillum iridis]|uniref:Lipoprotein n=1 Tax=Nitrospirillum iridis TaxID=765888 RepID=A0A7X0B1L4_9PROT|nr:hypothetical protein [Nitrospirillum iridis]MBB6252504.1 hypothetical protein [Nitrospirillum iridis]
MPVGHVLTKKTRGIILCALLVTSPLGACSSTTVQSTKSAQFTGPVKRLFIDMDMGEGLRTTVDDETGDFIATVKNTLASCGTDSDFHTRDALALNDTMPDRIRKFGPDSVLSIRWLSAQTQGATYIIHYQLRLTDLKSKSVVWTAIIDLHHQWSPAEKMAEAIIGRLKTDGLINSVCVAAGPK